MLKTFLLLLPMIFNTQTATVQVPVSVPESQSYCVIMELPDKACAPEMVNSDVSAVFEITDDVNNSTTRPMPYNNRRGGRRLPGPVNPDLNSQNNDNTSNGSGMGTTINNGSNGNGTGTSINNGSNGSGTGTSINNGSNTNGTGTTNRGLNNLDNEKSDNVKNNVNNNAVVIDDNREMYSSYSDGYNALRNKFENMFTLENEVDELRRELMTKETELNLHRDLYTQRLKALVEKWNKD